MSYVNLTYFARNLSRFRSSAHDSTFHACSAHIDSRRTFLKTAGAAVAGSFFAPAILGAADKAGTKPPLVGEGAFQYEVTHGWGGTPKHIKWGETHGVCVDEAGLIYIKHRSRAKTPQDAIVVFDADGKFVRSFGKEYHGGGHGIDVRKEGNEEFLYLSDVKHGIVAKTSLTGEVVWKIGRPRRPRIIRTQTTLQSHQHCLRPRWGILCRRWLRLPLHSQIHERREARVFLGGSGTEAGKMKTPHGMWLDTRDGTPKIAVCDRANHRLQYFSLDGKHLGFVNTVSFPADIDIQETSCWSPICMPG